MLCAPEPQVRPARPGRGRGGDVAEVGGGAARDVAARRAAHLTRASEADAALVAEVDPRV